MIKKMINKVLVIEDNVSEAIYAQTELAKAGIMDFKAVTTLKEGLSILPKYDAVLTDLFFPAGNIPIEQYIQKFLPLYEQFKNKRFPEMTGNNVVLSAIQSCAKVFGVTPEEYVNDYITKMNTPKLVLDAARDAIAGIKDSQKYEKFLKIEQSIRNGTSLPLGIIACEKALEYNLPCVIVTSTYHHDDAFEAVKDQIKVNYKDTLIEGRKNWKGGIELLLE
jgi:hypothetical protein